MNTTVKYEHKHFCTSRFQRKEIPKTGKNGTKLTFKSFNSKLAPKEFFKTWFIASSNTTEHYCKV